MAPPLLPSRCAPPFFSPMAPPLLPSWCAPPFCSPMAPSLLPSRCAPTLAAVYMSWSAWLCHVHWHGSTCAMRMVWGSERVPEVSVMSGPRAADLDWPAGAPPTPAKQQVPSGALLAGVTSTRARQGPKRRGGGGGGGGGGGYKSRVD
eukprot:708525-Prorocentrum_minimum.AAC.3